MLKTKSNKKVAVLNCEEKIGKSYCNHWCIVTSWASGIAPWIMQRRWRRNGPLLPPNQQWQVSLSECATTPACHETSHCRNHNKSLGISHQSAPSATHSSSQRRSQLMTTYLEMLLFSRIFMWQRMLGNFCVTRTLIWSTELHNFR